MQEIRAKMLRLGPDSVRGAGKPRFSMAYRLGKRPLAANNSAAVLKSKVVTSTTSVAQH
jgi:hypothetical protein